MHFGVTLRWTMRGAVGSVWGGRIAADRAGQWARRELAIGTLVLAPGCRRNANAGARGTCMCDMLRLARVPRNGAVLASGESGVS